MAFRNRRAVDLHTHLVADLLDGVTGPFTPISDPATGNARGSVAVDLQAGSTHTAATQVASGDASAVLGGFGNTASGKRAVALGGETGVASHDFQVAYGFGNGGRVQWSVLGWYGQSTDDQLVELFLAGGNVLRAVLPLNKVWLAEISGVARVAAGTDVFTFQRSVCVKDSAGVASLVGAVTTIGADKADAGAAAWAVAIDTTLNALRVKVSGDIGRTIKWLIVAKLTELST